MASRGGGGRGRAPRDYPARSVDKPRPGRSKAPPSRHLWVGNLSHNIVQSDLTEQLLRFGELDSVAFQPGRSYAFVNFCNDDDAIAALESLQGLPLAGNPLRIEFAKADKSSSQSHDEDQLHRRDESRSRESPFSQRDSRPRHASPDSYYPEKSKMSDRDSEPGEVLWIGFPPTLKVDETTLRKAFLPFGDLDKVTVFPGRSYAFVRFRSVISACRAKETLQGKLFGNPRVQICFAKSETASFNSGRSSESFRRDRQLGSILGDPRMRSPLISSLDSGDFDLPNPSRRGSSWAGDNDEFEQRLYGESDLGPPPDAYECRRSPLRERSSKFHDFPEKFSRKSPNYEDPWDLPEENLLRGAKKLKTGSFPPDKELPDYPYSRLEQEKHGFVRPLSDFPQPEPFDRSFGYKQIPDQRINSPIPHGERSDHWKGPYDNFPAGSVSLPPNPVERKRFTPEPERPSLAEWKWEGTIAKGGTPVCRARCFPVGKVLDMMLPEFLDCTARTGLDMLAKHYYQAAGAWVVFFVPGSDADMGFYNEFMHYLEEKQRAAVAKLDDKTTLFLVPPSDFSEKVLKVPGKLSISGVILRLEHPSSNSGAPYLPKEPNDPPYLKPSKPSGSFSNQSFLGDAYPGSGSIGNVTNPYNENIHGHQFQWNNTAEPSGSGSNLIPQIPNSSYEPVPVIPQALQEPSSSHNSNPFLQDTRHTAPLSSPVPAMKPELLAQLASSLLGQQRQPVSNNLNMNTMYQSENPDRTSQAQRFHHPPQNNQVTSELSLPQFSQQQQQQISNAPPAHLAVQREHQHLPSTNAQGEADPDPQKRLQATLQLAAALLQQIQQGKGT